MKAFLIESGAGMTIIIPETRQSWYNPDKETLKVFISCPTDFKDWEAEVVEAWDSMGVDEVLQDILSYSETILIASRDDEKEKADIALCCWHIVSALIK